MASTCGLVTVGCGVVAAIASRITASALANASPARALGTPSGIPLSAGDGAGSGTPAALRYAAKGEFGAGSTGGGTGEGEGTAAGGGVARVAPRSGWEASLGGANRGEGVTIASSSGSPANHSTPSEDCPRRASISTVRFWKKPATPPDSPSRWRTTTASSPSSARMRGSSSSREPPRYVRVSLMRVGLCARKACPEGYDQTARFPASSRAMRRSATHRRREGEAFARSPGPPQPSPQTATPSRRPLRRRDGRTASRVIARATTSAPATCVQTATGCPAGDTTPIVSTPTPGGISLYAQTATCGSACSHRRRRWRRTREEHSSTGRRPRDSACSDCSEQPGHEALRALRVHRQVLAVGRGGDRVGDLLLERRVQDDDAQARLLVEVRRDDRAGRAPGARTRPAAPGRG